MWEQPVRHRSWALRKPRSAGLCYLAIYLCLRIHLPDQASFRHRLARDLLEIVPFGYVASRAREERASRPKRI